MALRIGTWNVEYGCGVSKNARRLARLRDADCDLWVLTETHDDLSLGDGFHSLTTPAPRPSKATAGRWTTLWSRFPLERLPVLDPVRTVAALVHAPFGDLVVFGTVLPWHSDVGPEGTARVWTEFYRVVPEQGREWATLRAAHPHASFCVAGDLNMNLGGPHYYGTIKGRAMLREALAGAGLRCVTETERVPQGLLQHPHIDHVCLSEDLAARAEVVGGWEGSEADGTRLSDHSAVVVEIGAPEPTPVV